MEQTAIETRSINVLTVFAYLLDVIINCIRMQNSTNVEFVKRMMIFAMTFLEKCPQHR